MAKGKWIRLAQTATFSVAPLGGRPTAASNATFSLSPRGTFIAVLDGVPPAHENERDDEDALRVRVFSHDRSRFSEVLVFTPKGVGFRHGQPRVGRVAVSDRGTLAVVIGSQVHVVPPGGKTTAIEAPGATPFFDPIAPERLRLVVHRSGEVIETYDTATCALVDSQQLEGAGAGGFPPDVDPETGDVLLFSGWYAREGGTVVARGPEAEQPGELLRVGGTSLFLGKDAAATDAVVRRARDGADLPIPESFKVWRAAQPHQQVRASVDGRWLFSTYLDNLTLLAADSLEASLLPIPSGLSRRPGVVALLEEHLAIAHRFGLYFFDPRTGATIGDAPVALLGLAFAGERLVTVHEDGLRIDGGAPIPLAAPASIDGLRVAPGGRWAAVCCDREADGFPAIVIDLQERRELRRIEQAASITWISANQLAVVGRSGLRLLDMTSGEVRLLGAVPEQARLGSAGDGRLFVGTNTELTEYGPDGAVLRSHSASKKLKGYTWPSELLVHGEEVWVLAKRRVYRWRAGECERLTALEDGVGGAKLNPQQYDGTIRTLTLSPDGRLAVTAKTKSHALGVVLADQEGAILGWAGPAYPQRSTSDERAWVAFRGSELVVGTEDGSILSYAAP